MSTIVTRAGKGAPLAHSEVDANFTNLNADKYQAGDDPTFTNTQLAEIAASKSVTAVDVFVYDTSRDSDGGAWRKRTQHTSWYNETLNTATRGSRKEFPAVAVIVAEATKVTIYDGDDPALPMWMVFNGGGNFFINTSSSGVVGSVFAANGKLCVGQSAGNHGIREASFISEFISLRNATARYDTSSVISGRNAIVVVSSNVSSAAIVNSNVNDVAMTVLPNAPIDAATGLPVPTIAVATAGGVSVIKDDGTVVSDSHPVSVQRVGILGEDLFSYIQTSTGYVAVRRNFHTRTGVSVDNFGLSSGGEIFYRHNSVPALFPTQANNAILKFDNKDFGFNQGLFRLHEDPVTPSKGMVAYTTSTYNTGWQNGDIKGAFLSDTDDTDLVGSGELVTNGTFDTDTSGWSALNSATLSVVSGALRISQTTVDYGRAEQAITTEVGKTYTVSVELKGGTGAARVIVGTTSQGSQYYVGSVLTAAQTISATFTATTTTAYLTLTNDTTADNTYYDFDNVSVKLADADRSVNNNGLIVNGTVTRSPVATGADLVAYSGFSTSNYLEQPYNSDLDFGTGDFCVMGWVKSNTNNHTIVGRGYHSGAAWSGSQIFIQVEGGVFVGKTSDDGFATVDIVSGASPTNNWQHVTFVKSGSNTLFYVDAVLKGTTAVSSAAASLDNLNATLRLGLTQSGTGAFSGSLALLRISATAPTADQIRKIYEDEKFLFQENAQATLYGTSDAVTALDHDDATNLLHVGTSAGRSVFQGLRRVENTTTAVGTAISASNGLVVEE